MTKTYCPKCKSTTELSVELKRNFELKWDSHHDAYIVGKAIDGYGYGSTYEDDSEVTCGCGWVGRFDELKPTTEKYRVVLVIEVEGDREPLDKWDWKEVLDLYAHENVTVDGVNKL